MRYLSLLLILGGCVTQADLKDLKSDLDLKAKKLDINTYYLQSEYCKTNAMICAINTSASKDGSEGLCLEVYELCLSSALNEYHSLHGEDPPPLMEEVPQRTMKPKRAR